MFTQGAWGNPLEGGNGFCKSRSRLILSKYVTSTPIRSCMKPASNPASNSSPRSKRSPGLPGFNGIAPGATMLPS